jgi:hypothetical protein
MYDPFFFFKMTASAQKEFYAAWVQWWLEMVFETRALRNDANSIKKRLERMEDIVYTW